MFHKKNFWFVVSIFMLLLGFPIMGIDVNNGSVLFQDDFEDGNANGWILGSGWEVISDDTYVLRGQGHDLAHPLVEGWTNHSIEFRFKLLSEGFHFNFRVSENRLSQTDIILTKYFLEIQENLLILKKKFGTSTDSLSEVTVSLSMNTWHTLKVVMEKTSIEVYLDETLTMDVTDTQNPVLSGSFYFETFEDSEVYIDDISVEGEVVEKASGNLTWIRTGGPNGGLGYDIRIHPTDKNIMFVTDNPSGVNKSYDGGNSWVPSNNGITTRSGPSMDAIPIFCLTIDPNDPNIIWTGTQDELGIFRSADCGETWEKRDNGFAEKEDISFRNFAIHPNNSDTVFCGVEISTYTSQRFVYDMTKGKIYKTVDGGQNWYCVWQGTDEANNLVRFVLFDYTNPQIMYASTGIIDREAWSDQWYPGEGVGILKSTDGGENWFQINNGIPAEGGNRYVGFLEMHPTDPKILFAASGMQTWGTGGIFRTKDGGENWENVLSDDMFTMVTISPSNPDVVYAGSQFAVYRSDDGGDNWVKYWKEEEFCWGPPGIPAGIPISGVVDPDDPMVIFINNYSGGNFKSTDGGQTWINASKGYTGAQVQDIEVSKKDPAVVYVVGRSGGFRSWDGGEGWDGMMYSPVTSVIFSAVAINPKNSNDVLISDHKDGIIYKSSDGGLTWEIAYDNPVSSTESGIMDEFHAIAYAPSDTNVVYAGMSAYFGVIDGVRTARASQGMYKSTDGGDNWQNITNNLPTSLLNIFCVAVHPTDCNTVYIGTWKDGLYKSADGGQNWVAKNSGLASMEVRSIAIDPQNPSILYIGLGEGGGIYKTIDAGEIWQEVNNGIDLQCPPYLLPMGKVELGGSFDKIKKRRAGADYSSVPWTSIRDIVIDPTNSQVLYAADLQSGCYMSTDGGANWAVVNDSLKNRAIFALTLSGDGNVLYAAVWGAGVFRLVLGENTVPHISSTSPADTGMVKITQGDSLEFKVNAFDLDGDTLTYSWRLAGSPVQEGSSSSFVLKTTTLDLGEYLLSVAISDEDTTISTNWLIEITSPTIVAQEALLSVPKTYALHQNYPNPFNPETTIEYHLPQPSEVKLVIYDVRGQVVRELIQGTKPAGYHDVVWDGRNSQGQRVATGIYIYRIEMISKGVEEQKFVDIKKMVLMK
ncbi:T9SS type A sorting domain-containing protein [bacterium]|nr:T9SS type A sorting domain-containing protein [bacterium]